MSPLPIEAIQRYQRDGYLSPIPIMGADEVADKRARIEAIGAARGGQLPAVLNMKAHLLIPWLWDLVHDPRIVEPVVSLLGEDVLCWAATFFDKKPGTPNYVAWHQDSTYWGLERPDALTAWVAFTPSNRRNGCMRVWPGTHGDQLRHVPANNSANMLVIGDEELADPVVEEEIVDLPLEAGEMSLHHARVIHGSEPNHGEERRMGFAIRYIAGDLKGVGSVRGFATLVSGKDHGGFELEQRPEGLFHIDALRRYGRVLKRCRDIVGSEIRNDRATGTRE